MNNPDDEGDVARRDPIPPGERSQMAGRYLIAGETLAASVGSIKPRHDR
ncbi:MULTISPECIES: hypothetical protein [Pseudomonas]|nr:MULTISPECIES: hypothetical protein [Pseudomonas]